MIRRPRTPSTVPSAIGSTCVDGEAPPDVDPAGVEDMECVVDVRLDIVVVVKSPESRAV
jgi:hypothetical protein